MLFGYIGDETQKGYCMRSFEEDLNRAIAFHGHLCGGQITGVRMTRYALKYFGIDDPAH